jgi:hypothetical protein
LNPLDSIFEIIDIGFKLLVLLCLAVVVIVGFIEHRRGVGELTTDVANVGTGIFAGVSN